MLLAYGFLRKVFEVFEKYRTPIDMITTSEVAVSLTIDNDYALNDIVRELETFSTVEVDKNQTIISIVGNEIGEQPGTLKKVFDCVSNINVRMVSFGGSIHNISMLVNAADKKAALQQLNVGVFGLS
jgi:aspartate kinase